MNGSPGMVWECGGEIQPRDPYQLQLQWQYPAVSVRSARSVLPLLGRHEMQTTLSL